MASRHTLFRIFYLIGFTPWDGHPIGQSLRALVEGTGDTAPLPTGSALDVGCGTGDTSIYLAQHGWKVTGVDFVPKALDEARAKARGNGVSVNFVHGDVTCLTEAGIGADFQLIVDNGCLHNLSGDDRDEYVRQVSAVAAHDARLLIVAYGPGGSFGVPGIDRDEVQRRFTLAWALLSDGPEPGTGQSRRTGALHHYLFQRRP
ncbi:MAG: class I SAM-dependent methyltransferase [Mycobacterium sp.]|uniref:class I SAM-dependent methyltransferase n=1 Tax=Mycobacterium sp. TaxID=1785 RepID=UPI003CC6BB85